jgi:hypothetical protein
MTPRLTSLFLAGAAAAVASALLLSPGASGAAPECGLPAASPLWIDYGEASVKADVRAVLAKPGVVVATSGTAVPAAFRKAGAATAYFELHLPNIVGSTTVPEDSASILPEADTLYDRAVKATACATPWIALNELQGSQLPVPWSPTNTTYRANVLALVQQLAARGAHPALLLHGDPNVDGDAGAWWRTVSKSATLVYEAYYDASRMFPLGPVIANRRMRLGMRFEVDRFAKAGVPASRFGFMLGFHSAQTPGIAGRQGLEPTESWLRIVKWEALAARQVASETGVPTLWSWGWGTFGPESVDEDKAVAACTWLWTRDSALCNAPSMAGPAFAPSLVEGQIVVPAGVQCTFGGGRVTIASVNRLARLTKDRRTALTAQFARLALLGAAPVQQKNVLAVERAAIKAAFKGSRKAYLRALAQRGADLDVARGVIADELRRRALAAADPATTAFDQVAARETTAVDTAICLHDDLPGIGEPLAVGNRRDVGTIPLASFLPFLFRDATPPAAPAAPTAALAGTTVALTWPSGRETDLAGYDVVRTDVSGVATTLNTAGLVGRASYVDVAPPAGATYTVVAVDTSGNRSPASPAAGL